MAQIFVCVFIFIFEGFSYVKQITNENNISHYDRIGCGCKFRAISAR
jgi:hypothetical protein